MAEQAATIRRLRRSLAAAWAVAWILGLSILAWLAIRLNAALEESDLDTELALYATATYGLTWFDGEGAFHDEAWQQDPEMRTAPVDIWVLAPGDPPAVHLAPAAPEFEVPDLSRLVADVVADQQTRTLSGADRQRPYRLHAQPTYQDDVADRAVAAVVVVGDPREWQEAHTAFVRSLLLGLALLGALGVAVGVRLAHWSLRPVERSFEQRERFLAAVAHELRTPLASLRGVCESALAGDEPPKRALQRLTSMADQSSRVVDNLLLYARLDAGTLALERQAVRLDLLVESLLPESGEVTFEGEARVVEIDPSLVEAAVRNLLDNAVRHGAGPIVVSCDEEGVVVEDQGLGLPSSVRHAGDEPWALAPSRQGHGLGLSIVRWVARLHGGQLQLENRPQGGARARLVLETSRE